MTLVDLDFKEQLKETNFPDLLSAVPVKPRRNMSQRQTSRVARTFQHVSSLRSPNARSNVRKPEQQPRPDASRGKMGASSVSVAATTRSNKIHMPLSPQPCDDVPNSPVSSSGTSSSGHTSVRSPTLSLKDNDDLILDSLLVPPSKKPQQEKQHNRQPSIQSVETIPPQSVVLPLSTPSQELASSRLTTNSPRGSTAAVKRGDFMKQGDNRSVTSPTPPQPELKYPLTPPNRKETVTSTSTSPIMSPRNDFVETFRTMESQSITRTPTQRVSDGAITSSNESPARYEADGLFLDDELLCIIPRNRSSVSSLREGENDYNYDHHDTIDGDDETLASTEPAVVADHGDHRLKAVVQTKQESDDDKDENSKCSTGSSCASCDDGAKLLEKAKDRIARQNLLDEVVVLKAAIERKDEELENLHGQLRRAVATKCDLVIAHNELEKTHAQAIQRKENNLLRMKQANIWLLEAQSIKEKELINEIVRLTDMVKDTEQKHRDELDDWERMHRNEMLEKDFEIAKLAEELRRSGSMVSSHQTHATRRPFVTSKLF